MKATLSKLEKNRVALEIEVDEQQLAKAIDQAFKKLARQVNIPGFRKGKVPRYIFERYVGKEPLYSEAAEIVVPQAYKEAVAEQGIDPIELPEVEVVQLEEGKPFIYKATVAVKPEVSLGQYQGLAVTRPEVSVTEADIDQYLKDLQERYAEMAVVPEGPAAKGDLLNIDFAGSIDGVAREEMQAKDFPVEIGSDRFIPGFEDQLIGACVGEEKEIVATFPEDYRHEEFAGKEAHFQIKVLGIKRKELKPIDDEFARDVSECETLSALREEVRGRLQKARENAAESAVKNQAVAKAVENASVEIPPVMIERRLDSILNELDFNLRMQGLTLDKFLANSGKTIGELRAELTPRAETEVKRDLVLESIAKAEGIEATEADVDQEIERLAQAYNQEKEKAKETLGSDLTGLKYDIMVRKAVDLIAAASVAEPPAADGVEPAAEPLAGEAQAT